MAVEAGPTHPAKHHGEGARTKSAAGIPLTAPDGFALHVPGRPEAAEAIGRMGYKEPRLNLRRAEWGDASAWSRALPGTQPTFT